MSCENRDTGYKPRYSLPDDRIVEILFDRKAMKIYLRTDIIGEEVIDIPSLRNSRLYPYIEMKKMNTCIQFI